MINSENSSAKVLLITTEYPPGPGGIGSHAFSLSRGLKNKGVDINVVAITNYVSHSLADNFDASHPDAPKVFRLYNDKFLYILRRVNFIFKLQRCEKYTHIILSGFFALWMGAMLKMFCKKIKTIAVLHGTEINPPGKLSKWITHKAIASADYLAPVSKFTHSQLPLWLHEHSYKCIPNGIDPADMPVSNADSSFKLNGTPRLLTVGNVTPRKGQHRIIKALPTLLKSYPELHYHIVGMPSHKDEFQQLANDLQVGEALTFHGRLPDRQALANYYEANDIFIILSENQKDGDVEGFGIVVLEANHYGIPVIGALGCGVESAVNHDFNGLLVDGDNHEEITAAVERIKGDYQRYADNARVWAAQHDWTEISNQFVDIINKL